MKKGIYLILFTALISGLANFFNKFGMQELGKDAYQYTTLKNLVVALILSLVVITPLIWSKLKTISRQDWLKLILIGLIGGSIPFLLFFKGLSMTSAVNASFIHKTLFIWVAILAWPVLKERISRLQFLALTVLFAGNFIFGGLKDFSLGQAEFMIFVATAFWAIESIIAKIALKNLSSLVVAWARMSVGSIALLLFLLATGNTYQLFEISGHQLGWLVLVSVFLTGYVLTWYSALKRLPVMVTASFLVLASPITTLMNSIFITHQLDSNKVMGGLIIALGVILFWNFSKEKIYESKPVTT